MTVKERAALNVFGGLPRGCEPCLHCLGRGKRLHDPRIDPPGVHPAGPVKCRNCDGKGYNVI
jgi:hypothetical protein